MGATVTPGADPWLLALGLPSLLAAVALHEITLLDQAPFYSPGPAVRIAVGETVTWTNPMRNEGTTHTVTELGCFAREACTFDSGFIRPGDGFSHTFTQRGTYRYRCRLHAFMEGEIVVGDRWVYPREAN